MNLFERFFGIGKNGKSKNITIKFKRGPRIDPVNEAEYLINGREPAGTNPYSKVRWGNIVYYEDVKDCGYPICINKGFWTDEMVDNFSFNLAITSTMDAMTGRGATTKHKPMFYRCDQFFVNNKHLNVNDSDVPKECEWLHEFQNWYEDSFGEQPKIYRGDYFMNEPYFKYNQ